MTSESDNPIYRLVSLATNLRSILAEKGIEQKDLAKKLGVAASCVSDWVNGNGFPRGEKKLKKLAKVLDKTVAELVA